MIKTVSNHAKFPVVGIGASAGGLEALELFLSGVTPDSGMAYVIVQHLDPTHKGMMPELLQRTTLLPVIQAKNHCEVQKNHVYVLPPNHNIAIQDGILNLSKPLAPRGQRLPIDFFLNSLALDHRQLAVAVILSGMGSDGSKGLIKIKENAGLVLAQDPKTAAFNSMPQSAIDTGLVDIIAPAAELSTRIISSLREGIVINKDSHQTELVKSGLTNVLTLMQAHNGQDFSLYKKSTLYRRIERRMGIHQLGHLAEYVDLLKENAQELDLLFKEFLIGVTSFFRDPDAWDNLRDIALPALFRRHSSGHALRAWVPACSTGEEAYSLAIIFKEALEIHQPKGRFSLHIFATDLAQDAIDRARTGLYNKEIEEKVSADRLLRYFLPTDDGGYQIAKEVREMVIFAPQNMAQDPPFTKLDLLLCRNVLIYFGPELQKKLLALFHYTLIPGGILFLGNSETIGATTHLFEALDSKSRIYRRIESPPQALSVDFPTHYKRVTSDDAVSLTPPTKNLQSLADQLLLREFAPAAVLVNTSGDIIYICGRTGRYLEPAAGKANWNVYAMARNGLRHALSTALQQVVRDKGRIDCNDISVDVEGKTHQLDLTLQYIKDPEPLHGTVMIVFTELRTRQIIKRPNKQHPQTPTEIQLEKALQQAEEEVRYLREQMQTSGEELKSTNEELQSTNEELQSTNEELTTSKEEMQSLNEELQTVNVELQSRVDDLSRVSDDMQNLLNSTEVATIFLDDHLHIRRFTKQAATIIKLISADIGRPLSDLACDLDYPDLAKDAQEVLDTLIFSEKQVTAQNERWFTVRIMPYRTMQNRINGVVITFIDISVAKKLEAELRAMVVEDKPR